MYLTLEWWIKLIDENGTTSMSGELSLIHNACFEFARLGFPTWSTGRKNFISKKALSYELLLCFALSTSDMSYVPRKVRKFILEMRMVGPMKNWWKLTASGQIYTGRCTEQKLGQHHPNFGYTKIDQ